MFYQLANFSSKMLVVQMSVLDEVNGFVAIHISNQLISFSLICGTRKLMSNISWSLQRYEKCMKL
jgi:hypothetical protein